MSKTDINEKEAVEAKPKKSREKKDKETKTFDLQLNKEVISFEYKYLGWHHAPETLQITNPTDKLMAYKVKTNSRALFEVTRSMRILEPGETEEVTIWFRPGVLIPLTPNLHRCSVSYTEAAETDTHKSPKPMERVRIRCAPLVYESPFGESNESQHALEPFLRKKPDGVKYVPFKFPEKLIPPKYVRPAGRKNTIEEMPVPKGMEKPATLAKDGRFYGKKKLS